MHWVLQSTKASMIARLSFTSVAIYTKQLGKRNFIPLEYSHTSQLSMAWLF